MPENNKCVCGHYFDNHGIGPVEVEYVRYWHDVKENRLDCSDCNCTKYRSNSWWNKFWNGSE